jgi:hypothetical protein
LNVFKRRRLLVFLAMLASASGALFSQSIPSIAPALDAFVKSFKGRGALEDGSRPLAPEETIRRFKLAPGLKMEVVAHEPAITQPLNLHFDERGRMWVMQYIQYPFPAGLKIVKYDEHLRAVFDKVPPRRRIISRARDRVTILEDKDGDGVFESHKDFSATSTSHAASSRGAAACGC